MAKDVRIYSNIEIDPWDDVPPDTEDGEVVRIGILPTGTSGGKPVIVILTEIAESDKVVVSQITWQQFRDAVVALAHTPAIEMLDM